MILVIDEETINRFKKYIEDILIKSGAIKVLLVDMAGNLVVNVGPEIDLDVHSLAALSAANFGATAEIAGIIGEQDFSLLFHKGKKNSIHLTKIQDLFVLITIFNNRTSLGLMRLKIAHTKEKLFNELNKDGIYQPERKGNSV